MAAEDIDPRYNDPDSYDGKYPPDWKARRRTIYRRDDYTCQRCGTQSGPHAADDGARLDAHHEVPLSSGNSTNALDNLVTLCERCHNDQHDHDITEDDTSTARSLAASIAPGRFGETLGARGSRRTIRSNPTVDRDGPSNARERARPSFEYGFDDGMLGVLLVVVLMYIVGVQTVLARSGLTDQTGFPFAVGVALAGIGALAIVFWPREFAVASLPYIGLAVIYVHYGTSRSVVGPLVGAYLALLLAPALAAAVLESLWRRYKRRTTETI